jgi:integrase
MTLPSFINASPALPATGQPAGLDYGRALSLREMARHYTELPKYLLAPEVAGLLHFVQDWSQHAFFNTLWNTGARLNECLALRRRDFHLNESIPHVVLRTAKQRRAGGGRPRKGKVPTALSRSPIRPTSMRCAGCSPARRSSLRMTPSPANARAAGVECVRPDGA